MATFTVLESPDGDVEKVAFVREGFCWQAVLFTVLWALWQRLWLVAALLFALSTAVSVAANLDLLGAGFAALLQFGISLLFGFEARNLQVISLERAGYRRSGLIVASHQDAAELAYFAERAPTLGIQGAARTNAAHADMLGIFGHV